MFTTYKVVEGDTFEKISRKIYGIGDKSSAVSNLNPGVIEPLLPGITLNVPEFKIRNENNVSSSGDNTGNEIGLYIDNKKFIYWNDMHIRKSIDVIDVIGFGATFEPDNIEFRETFRPFSYKDIEVTVGNKRFFRGTMLNVIPMLGPKANTVSVDGYSLPGVMNDCMAPSSGYPYEYNNMELRRIAINVGILFNILVAFPAGRGAIFDRVALETNKKALVFLQELARQRNLIIKNNEDGDLVFLKSVDPGNPVARLEDGSSPLLSVSPALNAQQYYSDITGIEPSFLGLGGSQYTVKNKLLKNTLRPFVFELPDTVNADIPLAVNAKMGRMFANAISYNIAVDTWRDSSGNYWEPNSTIILNAPRAMIYKDYEFIVRTVDFYRDKNSETASMNLVLPGAFNGKIPEKLPWVE